MRKWALAGLAALLALAAPPVVDGSGAQTPPPVPSLTADPAVDLVDGQEIAVSGTGFAAESFLVIALCPAGIGSMYGCGTAYGQTYGITGEDGTFDASIGAIALLVDQDDALLADCRLANACELVAGDLQGSGIFARVAVHFDPDAPIAAPPTIVVDPAVDLVDGQAIDVTGSGFRSGEYPNVELCAADGATSACRTVGGGLADPAGAISASVTVRAFVRTGDQTTPVLDCRAPGTTCTLHARGGRGQPSNAVELHFDPTAPLLDPPQLTVNPAADLVDGATITITGTGFTPYAYPTVEICAMEGATPVGCRWIESYETGRAGEFELSVRARTMVWRSIGGDDADCRVVTCEVHVYDYWLDEVVVAPLHFAPDGALLPLPIVQVSPSTGIVDHEPVSVTGTGFGPGSHVDIRLCLADDAEGECDYDGDHSATSAPDGSLATEVRLVGAFTGWEGPVDCRIEPGCVVEVTDQDTGDRVRVPVTFAAPPAPRGRFLDPMFTDVDITHDVVYRTAIDSQGRTVDLKIDIYEPVGDTATERPALMWMHGGWFIFGDKESMADYALESARRGYVGLSLQYRLRPEITESDLALVVDAGVDATADAHAAVEWIIDNAATYRIDPDAILVGGYSAGGVLSWNLSYLMGARGASQPLVAGAAPIAGIPFGNPSPGDPPVIGFHAVDDPTVPVGPARDRCAEAVLLLARCEWVEYAAGGHGIVGSQFRDIVRRSHDFFFTEVLAPLGYSSSVDPPPPPTPVTRPEPPSTGTPRPPVASPPTGPSPPATTPSTIPSGSVTTTTAPRGVTTTTVPLIRPTQPGTDPVPTTPAPAASIPAPSSAGGDIGGAGVRPAAAARPVSAAGRYTG